MGVKLGGFGVISLEGKGVWARGVERTTSSKRGRRNKLKEWVEMSGTDGTVFLSCC